MIPAVTDDVGGWQQSAQPQPSQPAAPAPDWPSRMVDALFHLGLVGLLIVFLWSALAAHGPSMVALGGLAVALLAVLMVGRRRTQPMRLFLALALAAAVLTFSSGLPAGLFLMPPALFCLEAYDDRRWVRFWFVPGIVGALALWLMLVSTEWVVTVIAVVSLLSIVGWARGIRVQRLYRQSLLERIEVAERERDLRAAQAVASERARIARDIHDLVSHSLAVVAVQAAGAQRIAERDPAMAKEALGVISSTARDALAEMRGMLEVLRTPDAEAAIDAPSPGLPELEGLVNGLAAADVAVRLSSTGDPYRLAPGAELALYRVVQEALTNAVKHGDHTDVSVDLHYGAQALGISVSNRIARGGASLGIPGSGSGHVGMRERLALYGGTLSLDSTGGEYRVRAEIPRPTLDAAGRGGIL